MSLDLYDASVPVFLRYLDRLRGLVDAAQSLAGSDPARLLAARLAPDMLPFEGQVNTAAHFPLRACCPLAAEPLPPYGPFPSSLDGLRQRIERSRRLIARLEPARFDGAEARLITEQAGDAVVELPGGPFLLQFALPNFMFHLTMAYAILRSCGAPLGKADFDGWHRYDR